MLGNDVDIASAGNAVSVIRISVLRCLMVLGNVLFSRLLLCCAIYPLGMAAAAEPIKATEKKAASKHSPSRIELKSKAAQLAAGVAAADKALTPQELEIAQQIEVGEVACELGVSVSVKADPRSPGYFDIQGKKFRFRMVPVVTSTGALRLQDERAGAVWLQLANKSMLMSQKAGARLADACMSPTQLAVTRAMEKNPPPSLLEPLAASSAPTDARSLTLAPNAQPIEQTATAAVPAVPVSAPVQ
jgi:hypothetical protein